MSPTSEIKSAVESAAKALSDVGIKVDEARPSGIEQTFNLFMGLIMGDGGAGIQSAFPKKRRHIVIGAFVAK